MKNSRDLSYYKELKFKIEIEFIVTKDNTENYFLAYSFELGKGTCYGIGKTEEAAVSDFKENKDAYIQYLYENDIEIPLPLTQDNKNVYSGFFNVRTSPHLHSKAVMTAKENKVSLNKYINLLLSEDSGILTAKKEILLAISDLKDQLIEHDIRVTSKIVEYNKSAIKGFSISEEEERDILHYIGGEKFKYKKTG